MRSSSDLAIAVERALARLGLGWGWREDKLILLDTASLGRGNFPARISFEGDMLRVSSDPAVDLLPREREAMQNGPAKIETTDQGQTLVFKLLVPKERSLRRPRVLSPFLREILLLLERQRIGENKAISEDDALDNIKSSSEEKVAYLDKEQTVQRQTNKDNEQENRQRSKSKKKLQEAAKEPEKGQARQELKEDAAYKKPTKDD